MMNDSAFIVGSVLMIVSGVASIFGSILFNKWIVERDEKDNEKESKKLK